MSTSRQIEEAIKFPKTELKVKADNKIPQGELWINPKDFETLKNALTIIKKELQMYTEERNRRKGNA